MLITSPPAISQGYSLTRQMYYNNAIAVYGIIPFYALMIHMDELSKENPMLGKEVLYMRKSLLEFKDDKRFVDVVQNNKNLFNGSLPVQLTNGVVDAYFKELGYYEVYDIKNLKTDMENIIKFISNA